MKFKIASGSPLFDKLNALQEEMKRCNGLALDLVSGLGYTQMRGSFGTIAGGISSILIPSGKKPQGWKKTKQKLEFFPAKLKANKGLLDKISALPVVQYEDLNKILKFDMHDNGDDRRINFHPGINWKKNFILISIGSQYKNYKSLKGMVEIKESEYNKLIEQK